MKFSKEILNMLGWSQKSDDFIIGKDNFSNLQISSTPAVEQFYYFFHQKDRRLIKQFVLDEKKQVDYICRVTLIKKGDKFTPRLTFSVRDKTKKIIDNQETTPTNIKANVSLDDCYDNFWKLISFLQSLRDIELPKEKFSLVSQDEGEIVSALRGRGSDSVVNIIKLRFLADSSLYIRLDTTFCQRNNFVCEPGRKSFEPCKKKGFYLPKVPFKDIAVGRINNDPYVCQPRRQTANKTTLRCMTMHNIITAPENQKIKL